MTRGMPGAESGEGPVRLDKWLWAARFFKTRALAAEAIKGGHVHVNGDRVKPARTVRPGDRLTVRKGTLAFELEVVALSGRRGPAPEAQKLYLETEASRLAREQRAEERRLAAEAPHPQRRPDKRDRRRIARFNRGEG